MTASRTPTRSARASLVKLTRKLPLVKKLRDRFANKYAAELSFWRTRCKLDGGTFRNAHFQKIMLSMAQEPDDRFLAGKIVADFGCGPRGSLAWIRSTHLRIGIDVLVDLYADHFTDNLISHGMIYVKCTEKVIPLPSNLLDVMFTLNAIDHVNNFPQICAEIRRVIKPGGEFIASFNLEEPATACEPQTLTEAKIKQNLLDHMDIRSYRATQPGPKDNKYQPFYENKLAYQPGQTGYLWVRASMPL